MERVPVAWATAGQEPPGPEPGRRGQPTAMVLRTALEPVERPAGSNVFVDRPPSHLLGKSGTAGVLFFISNCWKETQMRHRFMLFAGAALSIGALVAGGCDKNDNANKSNTTSTGTVAHQNDMGGTMTGAGTTTLPSSGTQMMGAGAGSSGSTTQPTTRSISGDGGTSSSPANNAGR